MAEDDWDKLSRADDAPPRAPAEHEVKEVSGETDSIVGLVDDLAPQLIDALAALEAAKTKVKQLTEDLARFAPEIAGEVQLRGTAYVATVRRAERFEWDSDVLAALYDAGELPPYIKKKLSVDKKRYDRMTDDDRDALKSALTIKLSAPSIEVSRNV